MSCITSEFPTYWVINTTERFTIADDIEESTTISIDPNSGTSGGSILNYDWLSANLTNSEEFPFIEDKYQDIEINNNDVHLLIIVNNKVGISNIREFTLGQLASLTLSEHYEVFQISILGSTYTCTYIRDLTSTKMLDRKFRFDIKKI